MASINVDLDYRDHPKTRRLIATLGRGADVIPIRLWIYCGKYHAEYGIIAPPFTTEIESIVGWWGPKGQCVDALIECGFLDRVGESLHVHDWQEHAGHIHAAKVKAKLMAKARWEKLKDDDAPSITGSTAPSSPCGNAKAMQGSAGQGSAGQGSERPPPLRPEQIPSGLRAQARSLVDLYRSVVTSAHPAGRSAEDAAANAMAWHPTRSMADWERAIRGYGEHMDRNDTPKSKRQSARRFFEDETWAQYIDGEQAAPKKSFEEEVREAAEENVRKIKAARGLA